MTAEETIARQLIINQLALFQASAQRLLDELAETRRRLQQTEQRIRQELAHAHRFVAHPTSRRTG